MTPEQAHERTVLYQRIAALIERLADGSRDDSARDQLLVALAHYQTRWVEPYARFVSQRKRGSTISTLADVPALPTDAFRIAPISSRAADAIVRTFKSSGTTHEERSSHSLADLSLYDAAARAAARYALFPDRERMQLVILAPSESELADSSLSYMLARFIEWFGTSDSAHVWPIDGPNSARLEARLREAERTGTPLALLGTSFAFVHTCDALGSTRFALPAGSRIMQTGGFKGRSREVAPHDMRRMLTDRFGLDEAWVIAEYGMTELSSQLYETTLREAALGQALTQRRLWAPGWVRALPVDPESLAPLTDTREGLIRVDDAANLDSVCAIQTADVGVREQDGLIVLGRARGAIARGCSITTDELLRRGAR